MSNGLVIYLSLYSIVIGGMIMIGFFLQLKKEKQYYNSDTINLKDLVVLIPFRNEENRIGGLLKSIQKLSHFPHRFVFINDHSEDDGVKNITNALTGIDYEILTLPEGVSGKKMALRYAMNNLNTNYVLTIDADVYFHTDFFYELGKLSEAEMYLRPAIMKAESAMEYLYEIDLALVNAANVGLAGWKRPIMASGANLFYNRQVFNTVDSIEEHVAVASGDDMYLLKDFRENRRDVRLVSDPKQAVFTETPQSFKEFIDQRLRWLGKTGDLKDHLSTSLALIQSALTLAFFTLILYFAINGYWNELLLLFLLKTGIDMLVFFPYMNRIHRLKTWLFIPIYELLFPLYTMIILALVYTYKPSWKGRKIKHSQ